MNINMIMNNEEQDQDHDQHQQAWNQVSALNCQKTLNMNIINRCRLKRWFCEVVYQFLISAHQLTSWTSDLQVYWNGKSIKMVLCAVFYHLLLRNAWVVRGLEGGILEQGWSHSTSTTTIFWLYDWGRGEGQCFYDQGSKICGIKQNWLWAPKLSNNFF